MTTVYDVPAAELIAKVGTKLKENEHITFPEWAIFVKTGTHREKEPEDKDWWFTRLAAILRKIYMNNGIGTERLSAEFGGPKDRGSKPNKAVRGSRSIARKAMVQLEQAGYVEIRKGVGRVITPAGRSFLDNTSREVLQEIIADNPELGKY